VCLEENLDMVGAAEPQTLNADEIQQ